MTKATKARQISSDNGTWRNRIVGHGEEAPDKLLANPRNWRTHPKAQREALAGVLDEVGWVQDIIVNRRTGLMVDGHLRVELAVERGEANVPVKYVDLDEGEETLILATLDPLAGMAGTATDALEALLATATPAGAAVKGLLEDVAKGAGLNGAKEGLTDPDAVPEVVEPVAKRGDVWVCGEHRVMCGDSTDAGDVARLMAGEKVDAVVTDPPYGIGMDYGEMADTKEALAAIVDVFLPLARALSPVVAVTPDNGNQAFYPAPDWMFGWFFGSGRNYTPYGFQNWQPILVWGKDPYLAAGLGARPDAFWISEAMEDVAHPCPKPTRTWMWLVERFTTSADAIILDPFLGSGTTMIAAERLGRRCYGCEIEPRYVQVAIERWQNFTGRKAERE